MIVLKLAVFVWVITGTTFAFGQHQEPAPLWTKEAIRDLSSARNLGSPKLIDPGRAGVTFIDDKQLLVYQVDLEPGQLSSREGPEVRSAFRLDASVFDPMSGQLLFVKTWGTGPRESSILATCGGVVMRTGPLLRFFAKDFKEIKRLPLLQSNPYEGWKVTISSSGKTILINHYLRDVKRNLHKSDFDAYDGCTFDLMRTWAESPALNPDVYSISDLAIVTDQYAGSACNTILEPFASKIWKPVWERTDRVCASVPTFVTDSSLVYGCKGFSWVSTNGEVLMTDRFGKDEHTCINYKIAVARNGKYVAVPMEKARDRWDSGAHTLSMRVAVYDLDLKARTVLVTLAPLPKVDYDFALSPDGSKLAVLNDRNISIYSVPSK